MQNLKLEKYLNDKKLFTNIIKNINNIKDYKSATNCINTIANVITNVTEYNNFNSLHSLSDTIVNFIENINNKKELDIEEIKNKLDELFTEFYRDVLFGVKIEIYFLGEDKYNLINNKYTNFEIKKIKSINDANKKTNCFVEKAYKILVMEDVKLLENTNVEGIFDKIYKYEDVVNEFFTLSKTIYKYNYDYNFLKNEFKNAKKQNCNTLIVGNSYPLAGIDKTILKENAFNLSMHSQDLYYSYKLAKECITVNKSIKKCIIGVGYYLTYHDLSMGASEYSRNMIKNIYMPILKDTHNSEFVEKSTNLNLRDYIKSEVLSTIFKLENIYEYMSSLCYNIYPTYFNEENTREDISALRGVKLEDISYEDKVSLGKQRAYAHNNLIKYSKTDEEFGNILKGFLSFLKQNNVEAIIVVFPSTKYYSDELSSKYSEKFYNIIEDMKKYYDFKLVDFKKYNIFDDSDFIDMDHLGEKGCIKVTNYLNEMLY